MSYMLVPLVIVLGVFLAGGIALIADGGFRLLRDLRR
jgi:hypothetical protein